MSAQAREANKGLDLTGKTAVIAGASQGIGAGIAIRFAQAGANIIILGRSKAGLEGIVAEARKVAKSADQKLDYISADLSVVSGTKTAAKEIAEKSNGNVEYLVQTQGGMPTGHITTTADGVESHFAVQVLNRFTLNYLLASAGVLKDTSISIMNPGGSQTEFNLDELEVKSTNSGGSFSLMRKQMLRDGLVADTYTKALQSKFPQIKFFHVSPGVVQTGVKMNRDLPFPLRQFLGHVVVPIAARTFGDTRASYADIPVFLAANPKRESVISTEGYFLNNKNKKATISPYAANEKNQQALLEKLNGYVGATD